MTEQNLNSITDEQKTTRIYNKKDSKNVSFK